MDRLWKTIHEVKSLPQFEVNQYRRFISLKNQVDGLLRELSRGFYYPFHSFFLAVFAKTYHHLFRDNKKLIYNQQKILFLDSFSPPPFVVFFFPYTFLVEDCHFILTDIPDPILHFLNAENQYQPFALSPRAYFTLQLDHLSATLMCKFKYFPLPFFTNALTIFAYRAIKTLQTMKIITQHLPLAMAHNDLDSYWQQFQCYLQILSKEDDGK